ncbi:putative protein N(5)-glutamine methyltransferase [Actinokineospora fastidiosa]|uniref:peptide chain release factor N(5)-glutamine methyltransferase n=1 Tax=Actinokineospora fastidiosa TaxID=1816 RepID=A0A918GNP0_9PSEU|nr:putative protein N(5)-glutamine methyltransferase [Actinokineospora fastidiosa]GGS47868.1 methylase [Actinokineospora fastidiosa]
MDGYDETVARLRAAGCVFAEEEAALLLDLPDPGRAIARRVAGEPLEHVLGWAEFAGLRVAVDAGVFVPRRRTEALVRAAVAAGGSVVVDLCCGSGAVGMAVEAALGAVDLTAVDIDPRAVACARRNLGADRVLEGDLYAPLPERLRGRVDLLVVNAPYVPTDEIALMPPEARDHEPMVALDGGSDGLDVHRRVAEGAPDWLAPGGLLLIEAHESQVAAAEAVFAGHGLVVGVVRDPEATVVTGALGTRQGTR